MIRPPRTRCLVIPAMLGLFGCVTPTQTTLAPPPAGTSWSAQHSGPLPLPNGVKDNEVAHRAEPWWTALQDQTLNALISTLLAENLDLQTATLRMAQSRLNVDVAQSQSGPNVNGGGSIARERQSRSGAQARTMDAIPMPDAQRETVLDALHSPFTLYQAGIDAAWELDFWGRVKHSIESAEAATVAREAQVRTLQQLLIAELTRTYLALRATQAESRLVNQSLDLLGRQVQLQDQKFKGGLVDDTEGLQLHAALSDLQNQRTALAATEGALMTQITLLLGHRPGTDDARLAATGAPIPSLPPFDLGVPSDVLQQRPDIAEAQANFQQAVANTGVAVADLYPRITLGAGFSLSTVRSGQFFDMQSSQWSLGPSLTIPIFDQGRRRALITLSEKEQQIAAIQYQKTVLQAWTEVDGLLTQLTEAQRTDDMLKAKAQNQTLLLQSAKAKSKHGLTDQIPALVAERNWLSTQQSQVRTTLKQAQTWVSLQKALGISAQ